jgi:hypothetical protein
MNRKLDLERRLADYYATEASSEAPDWLLATALRTIESTPQRRVLVRVPWRFPIMNGLPKAAVAAVGVVALAILGIALFGQPGGFGGGPTPLPTVTPAPTPSPTLLTTAQPAPTRGTTTSFQPSFSFLFPEGATFDYGKTNSTYVEVRVPEWADAGHPGGMIIQAIGDGRADVCDGASAALPIAAGAQPVFDYLKTLSVLDVTNERDTTVDGLPAREATVVAGPETDSCPDLWLWVEDTESFGSIPRGMVLRMVAVDVGGEHVVMTIYGESDNPSWPAMADELIASIQFVE